MSTIHAPQRISAVAAALQHPDLADRTVRPNLIDRVAIKVAVRLLLWSTRPGPTRDALRAVRGADAARSRRERVAARAFHTCAPLR